MLVYAATQAGINKPKNEDAILLGDVFVKETTKIEIPPQGFMALCDGVGGNPGGGMAAGFVLEYLRRQRFWGGNLNENSMRAYLYETNRILIKTAEVLPQYTNMATTMTAIYLDHRQNYLVHVGDTRAWYKQGRYLKQLTHDHTRYNELKTQGLNAEAMLVGRNVITACFGGGDTRLLKALTITPLTVRGMVILTSDGIHDYVDVDTLEGIMLAGANQAVMCEAMLTAALKNGSHDDISVIILKI